METWQINKHATWRKLLDLVDFLEIFFHGYNILRRWLKDVSLSLYTKLIIHLKIDNWMDFLKIWPNCGGLPVAPHPNIPFSSHSFLLLSYMFLFTTLRWHSSFLPSRHCLIFSPSFPSTPHIFSMAAIAVWNPWFCLRGETCEVFWLKQTV